MTISPGPNTIRKVRACPGRFLETRIGFDGAAPVSFCAALRIGWFIVNTGGFPMPAAAHKSRRRTYPGRRAGMQADETRQSGIRAIIVKFGSARIAVVTD